MQSFETGQTWKGHKVDTPLLRKRTVTQGFQMSFNGWVWWYAPTVEVFMAGRGFKQPGVMGSVTAQGWE